MKFFSIVGAALLSLALCAGAYAQENPSVVTGAWQYGQGTLTLDSDSESARLYLKETSRSCGTPSASYGRVRQVLWNNGADVPIRWWLDKNCNTATLRICVINRFDEAACMSYEFVGITKF